MQITDGTTVSQTTATTTSCSYPCQYSNVPIQYGWECPRCHSINAPWASQCSCTGNKSNLYYYTIETNQDQLGAINNNNNKKRTPYSITLDDSNITIGGSDYKTIDGTYVNVPKTQSNTIDSNTVTYAWKNAPCTKTIQWEK